RQFLAHERWDGASVVEPHARPEGIEDPNDARVDAVCAVVRHSDRFTESLCLVVHAARTDRIDVTPVVLALWVHEWVAVDLRGRGEQEASALRLGHPECVVGAPTTALGGL